MSDLVKRLRIYGRQATDEAADRIEALEAALHEIDDKSIDHVAGSIARTALKRVNQQNRT